MDLDRVREEASKAGLVEIYYNATSRVISFAATHQKPPPTRINVYYTTGTVGTCLDHPRQGKTQLFRRNLNLPLLAQLFQDPRLHTGTGYYRCPTATAWTNKRGPDAVDSPHPVKKFCEGMPPINDPLDEEAELRAQVTRLKAETADVESILAACVERRQREEAALLEEEKLNELWRPRGDDDELHRREREARGTSNMFLLEDGHHVQKLFSPQVTCVATNGTATIMLYENGNWAFTATLPKQLYNKLNGRQRSLPLPVYVALGSMDRYYIRFADGKSEGVGCDEMSEKLRAAHATSRRVKTVAFGETWDSYFVVFDDGGWMCRGVPDGLVKKINARNQKPDLECVSLGGAGAWYLKAMNGKSWWGGVDSDTMADIKSIKDRLTFLDFGSCHHGGNYTEFFARCRA